MSAALAEPGVGNVLTVHVAGEVVALPAGLVAEIVRPPKITRVPNGPPALLGVANLRGQVLPVVCLAALLGGAARPSGKTSRIVVLAGVPVGLHVDAVAALARADGVRRIDPAALLAQTFGAMLRRAPTPLAAVEPDAGPADSRRHELSLIGLRLGGQDYALPLDKVAEVMRVPAELTAVPHTDTAMLGVIAYRGGVLPLVSLRVLLGLPAQAGTRVVVTNLSGLAAGLVVDAATAAMSVPAAAIDPVPPVLMRGRAEAQADGVCRLDGGRRLVCLLSPARLLDAATVAALRSHAGQETAAMPSLANQDGGAGADHTGAVEQFVIFQLGDEQYGLPIGAVDEVVRHPGTLTQLPRSPGFVDGVMNLRGRVVPVIDQRRRFGVAGAAARGRRVVVVALDGMRAGFVVDAVSAVLSVPASELHPAPAFDDAQDSPFDRAAIERDGRIILLVSPRALLNEAERDLLSPLLDAEPL